MINEVYLTNTASYLPNEPIGNEEIEEYLGLINGKASRARGIVLRNNGIKRRFYALEKDGKSTHTNAQMTSLAVRALFNNDSEQLKNFDLLSCGTSTPDQMIPSHGVMVHGWLPECNAIEVVSPSGVCCSGMHAFKYAYMAVKTGQSKMAISTGSERVSRLLRSEVYEEEIVNLTALEENPYIAFEKDFLRWMLSDGAGAFLLSNTKNEEGLSLRVDWLEGVSYAHEVEACMYMASEKEDGQLKSYMDYDPKDLLNQSIFSIKQDVKLLSSNIISLGFQKLRDIWDEKGLKSEDVDFFLPHMSSEFFRSKLADALVEHDMHIPQEKWFTNLSTMGNVGSASIYLMVDELYKSGKLQKGNKILLAIPESSRFSYVFGLLTVC